MGKVLLANKIRMHMLCEQGYGATAMTDSYPLRNWKMITVKKICQRVDATGSVTECKASSGRLRCACSVTNIECVQELIRPQEGQHQSTREVTAELDISDRSVWHIASQMFRWFSAQVLYATTIATGVYHNYASLTQSS